MSSAKSRFATSADDIDELSRQDRRRHGAQVGYMKRFDPSYEAR